MVVVFWASQIEKLPLSGSLSIEGTDTRNLDSATSSIVFKETQ